MIAGVVARDCALLIAIEEDIQRLSYGRSIDFIAIRLTAFATDNRIVAEVVSQLDVIVAIAGRDAVSARACRYGVVASASSECIIARAPGNGVCACPRVDVDADRRTGGVDGIVA